MALKTRDFLILLTLLLIPTLAWADAETRPHKTTGKLDPESIGQLTFGPDDVLFVADSTGTAVYAIDLADRDEPSGEPLESIDDVDEKVGALLGTTARDIRINDIAVHPKSRNVYLSVSRGQGEATEPVLVKATAAGKLSVVELGKASYTKAMVNNAPDADAKDRRGRSLRAMTITDIAYSDGYLYVAGLSNEEFASNLRKISYPFKGEMKASSVEIYHGAHNKYETHAPITTFMPYEIEGEPHLLAAYTCTPLVTFPMDDLADGKHVKGKTIAELGFGNRPMDMIQFDRQGVPYILVINSSRGAMKIKTSDIDKAEAMSPDNTKIGRDKPTAGVPYVTLPMAGVLRADNYNDDNLVVLRRDLDRGGLQLGLFSKRWL